MKPSKLPTLGFTLLELVIIIVVVSITASAMFGIFGLGAAKSVDPILRVQGVAIAQGYLEEILLKSYSDPDGLPDAGGRSGFDDVVDYNGLANLTGALDQFGNPLAGLSFYNINVAVLNITLGSAGQTVAARQISVVVTHDSQTNFNISLAGYKTSY